MTIANVTFGSDAEVFLKTLTQEFFPVCDLVGGTKERPRSLGDGYFIQEDNVALEFNIPVCKDSKSFQQAFSVAFVKIAKEIPKSLIMSTETAANFSPVYISQIPQAQVFGCDPDYNVWELSENPKPFCDMPYLRTAAAHVHIGWEDPTDEDRIALVKFSDIFVSTLSWMYPDRLRRKLYGKAGAFRPKDYGIEHRVLSNEWIFDPKEINRIFNGYLQAIEAVNLNLQIEPTDEALIQKAINSYDSDTCSLLWNKYDKKLKTAKQIFNKEKAKPNA